MTQVCLLLEHLGAESFASHKNLRGKSALQVAELVNKQLTLCYESDVFDQSKQADKKHYEVLVCTVVILSPISILADVVLLSVRSRRWSGPIKFSRFCGNACKRPVLNSPLRTTSMHALPRV